METPSLDDFLQINWELQPGEQFVFRPYEHNLPAFDTFLIKHCPECIDLINEIIGRNETNKIIKEDIPDNFLNDDGNISQYIDGTDFFMNGLPEQDNYEIDTEQGKSNYAQLLQILYLYDSFTEFDDDEHFFKWIDETPLLSNDEKVKFIKYLVKNVNSNMFIKKHSRYNAYYYIINKLSECENNSECLDKVINDYGDIDIYIPNKISNYEERVANNEDFIFNKNWNTCIINDISKEQLRIYLDDINKFLNIPNDSALKLRTDIPDRWITSNFQFMNSEILHKLFDQRDKKAIKTKSYDVWYNKHLSFADWLYSCDILSTNSKTKLYLKLRELGLINQNLDFERTMKYPLPVGEVKRLARQKRVDMNGPGAHITGYLTGRNTDDATALLNQTPIPLNAIRDLTQEQMEIDEPIISKPKNSRKKQKTDDKYEKIGVGGKKKRRTCKKRKKRK
jgi:hypothetical protein